MCDVSTDPNYQVSAHSCRNRVRPVVPVNKATNSLLQSVSNFDVQRVKEVGLQGQTLSCASCSLCVHKQ
jgi:hypothetical protein